jgi:hypothetical protein
VAAAVAIQQAVHRLNSSRQAPASLHVRVGLSAGDVTFEGDDVHGPPVVQAARLCEAARRGEILASELVRGLVSPSGGTAFTVMGALELKGFRGAVPAVRVEWAPVAVPGTPLRVYLSGRVRIENDGLLLDERSFPGRQGRLAFAYLVVERSRAVSRDELAEVLWPDTLPAAWETALSAIITRKKAPLILLKRSRIWSCVIMSNVFRSPGRRCRSSRMATVTAP